MQVGGDHYKKLKVQPWDAMEAWMTRDQFLGYLRGNVIKYVARDKNGLEDLEKAQHYLQVLMEKTKAATPPCPCPIPPPVAPSGIPSDAVCYFMDGDTWFCVRPDFIDLQMSPAGYGKTQDAAYYSLLDEETAGLQ